VTSKATSTPRAGDRSGDGVAAEKGAGQQRCLDSTGPAPSRDAASGSHVEQPGQGARSPSTSRHVPLDVRRTVLCRDGLRCAWVGPDGTRCGSRAWLEHDHAVPRGRGGDSGAANIRPFCRAHNQLAAECAYGRDAIARIITCRRARRRRPPVVTPDANNST
jgi:hypothetical protein